MEGGGNEIEEIKQLCNKIETSKDKTRIKASKELIQKLSGKKPELLKYTIFETMMNKLYESDQKIYFDLTMNLFEINSSEFGIFREKLLNKTMKKILDCNTNESIIRDISLITNYGKNLLNLKNKKILIQYIFFKCLLKEKMFNHKKLWMIIENIICQNNNIDINIIQVEFYCNICVMLSFTLKHRNDINNDVLDSIIHISGYYLLNLEVNNYLITKNIILMLLYIIPYKEEIILNFFKKKPFKFLQIINELLKDYHTMENHFSYSDIQKFFLFNDEYLSEIINEKEEESIYKLFERNCNIKSIINSNIKLINEHIYDFIHILFTEYKNVKFDKENQNIIKIDDVFFFEYIIKILRNNKDNNELLDKVILNLNSFIMKNGNNLFEQWKYIFKIINDFFLVKNDDIIELYNNREELFESIEKLYQEENYFGNFNDLKDIVTKITVFKNEILVNFQINLLLKDSKSFLSNIEKVIVKLINNYPNFSFCKNYLIEILINNYNYAFISEGIESEKIKLIDNLMFKYFSNFLKSFNNIESNYILFGHLISIILTKTSDLNYFETYLDILVHLNLDTGDNITISNNFSINIIRELFENLCLNWDTIKLRNFLKYFFGKENRNDVKILKYGVRLIKNIIVDEAFQIITPNHNYSPLIINYKNPEIEKQKEKLDKEHFKKFKKDFYLPFIKFKHIKIYQALNHQLLGNTKNLSLIKDILIYYITSLKSFFFLKEVNLEELILIIAKDEDISKISLGKDITRCILEIFSLLNYQLNTNLISDDNIINNQSIFKIHNNYSLSTKIIFSLLNSWNKLNDENLSYLKNYPKQNFFDTKFNTVPIWTGQLTLSQSLSFICEFIKILKCYLFSLTDKFNKIKKEPSFYSKLSSFDETLKEKLIKEYGNNDLNKIIDEIIHFMMDSLFFVLISKEYSISIISLLYEIRDLIVNFGDDKILNVIYIILMIGWPTYQDNITNNFDKFFFTKFNMRQIKKEKYYQIDLKSENKDLLNSLIGNEYVQFFADITCLYYLEKIEFSKTMWETIKNIFPEKEKQKNREIIFLSMVKWNLMTRTKRTNLSDIKADNNSLIYIGNNNLIIIIPKTKVSCEICFKNFFVDIHYSISSNYQKNKKVNKSKDDNYVSYTKENYLFPEKDFSITDEDLQEMNLNSKEIFLHLINNTGGLIEDYTLIQEKNLNKVIDNISQLDLYSPFLTYFCGIIYFPNIKNYNLDEILFYKGQVSSSFVNFLGKIGDLYDINLKENLLIEVGNTLKKKNESQYILCYKDSLSQIIFHVTNLLNEDNIKEIIFEDEISLIWMENPQIETNLFISKFPSDKIYIFIVIFPVTETHYFVKRYYNSNLSESFRDLIDKIFLDEIIININNINSLYQILKMILQIKEMIKYEKYHLEHLNSLEQLPRRFSFGIIEKKIMTFHKQIDNFLIGNNFTKRKEIISEIIKVVQNNKIN